jgi:hypothetical protein
LRMPHRHMRAAAGRRSSPVQALSLITLLP